MISEYYFFDQHSKVSHIGGVHRSKRNLQDLHQALYHVKIALPITDDSNRIETNKPAAIKKSTKQTMNDIMLQTIFHKLKAPIIPETLIRELDILMSAFDDESSSSSLSYGSKRASQTSIIDDKQVNDGQDELIDIMSNSPKVSLPSSLIVELNSTWSDLVQKAEYEYKMWHTRAGEEAWHQHVQRRRSRQINFVKQKSVTDNRLLVRRQTVARGNYLSSVPSQQQSLMTDSKIRSSRPFSRTSFNTTNASQENRRLFKMMQQGNTENQSLETIKNGINVEFKLSKCIDNTTQKTPIVEQKIASFDVPKLDAYFDKDMIAQTQHKCKRLLAEAKQKIFATTNDGDSKQPGTCRIWFYEDNPLNRNKSQVLKFNDNNRRPLSAFALAILRYEIPEKYNIKIDIPESKNKCYISLLDGSNQIYYPSGRLAALCLRSSLSTALFFDDTSSTENQFLGLVTSSGSVIIMQPTLHARFICDNERECAYSCDGKRGTIEKQFQYRSSNNDQSQSTLIDKDDVDSVSRVHGVQYQLNSCMQLDYYNPSNIRFLFKSRYETFQLQLGTSVQKPLPTSSSVPIIKSTIKKYSQDKKFQTKSKRATLMEPNDILNISEQKQINHEELFEEQLHLNQLPMFEELNVLRKRIRQICDNWLKHYRTILGIFNIDAYYLPDLPATCRPISTQTRIKLGDIFGDKSSQQPRQISTLTKQTLTNFELVKSTDAQQFTAKLTADKSELNAITNAIEQFIPQSDIGLALKQQIYEKIK